MAVIFLHDCTFSAHIGAEEREREKSQQLLIDVELTLDISKITLLNDTIDYNTVHNTIGHLLETKQYVLVEELARIIADELLRFPAETVLVRVKKPGVAAKKGCREIGVEYRVSQKKEKPL